METHEPITLAQLLSAAHVLKAHEDVGYHQFVSIRDAGDPDPDTDVVFDLDGIWECRINMDGKVLTHSA